MIFGPTYLTGAHTYPLRVGRYECVLRIILMPCFDLRQNGKSGKQLLQCALASNKFLFCEVSRSEHRGVEIIHANRKTFRYYPILYERVMQFRPGKRDRIRHNDGGERETP